MSASWAYLYLHPETDPEADRTALDRGGIRTTLVAVPSADRAPEVAAALASEGATLIELCGGFSLEAAAAVRAALPPRWRSATSPCPWIRYTPPRPSVTRSARPCQRGNHP